MVTIPGLIRSCPSVRVSAYLVRIQCLSEFLKYRQQLPCFFKEYLKNLPASALLLHVNTNANTKADTNENARKYKCKYKLTILPVNTHVNTGKSRGKPLGKSLGKPLDKSLGRSLQKGYHGF